MNSHLNRSIVGLWQPGTTLHCTAISACNKTRNNQWLALTLRVVVHGLITGWRHRHWRPSVNVTRDYDENNLTEHKVSLTKGRRTSSQSLTAHGPTMKDPSKHHVTLHTGVRTPAEGWSEGSNGTTCYTSHRCQNTGQRLRWRLQRDTMLHFA